MQSARYNSQRRSLPPAAPPGSVRAAARPAWRGWRRCSFRRNRGADRNRPSSHPPLAFAERAGDPRAVARSARPPHAVRARPVGPPFGAQARKLRIEIASPSRKPAICRRLRNVNSYVANIISGQVRSASARSLGSRAISQPLHRIDQKARARARRRPVGVTSIGHLIPPLPCVENGCAALEAPPRFGSVFSSRFCRMSISPVQPRLRGGGVAHRPPAPFVSRKRWKSRRSQSDFAGRPDCLASDFPRARPNAPRSWRTVCVARSAKRHKEIHMVERARQQLPLGSSAAGWMVAISSVSRRSPDSKDAQPSLSASIVQASPSSRANVAHARQPARFGRGEQRSTATPRHPPHTPEIPHPLRRTSPSPRLFAPLEQFQFAHARVQAARSARQTRGACGCAAPSPRRRRLSVCVPMMRPGKSPRVPISRCSVRSRTSRTHADIELVQVMAET